MYKYMRIYVYTCSYTDIHTLVHILYTCLHLWINYISIFIYIYIYIYIYILYIQNLCYIKNDIVFTKEKVLFSAILLLLP